MYNMVGSKLSWRRQVRMVTLQTFPLVTPDVDWMIGHNDQPSKHKPVAKNRRVRGGGQLAARGQFGSVGF